MSDYFIYVGNAYPHKNLSRLIDAVILLKTNLKIVSGRSVFAERLKKEITNKKSEKLVEILGFVTDENLNKLYKNSIAFVFPTLAEGFGLPPMEAITAGTMAVVSDIPVLKEVYDDSVLYFDPMDVNSIAKELEKAINLSVAERKNKIAYAQKFVKKYAWSKMAKETLKVYESSIK